MALDRLSDYNDSESLSSSESHGIDRRELHSPFLFPGCSARGDVLESPLCLSHISLSLLFDRFFFICPLIFSLAGVGELDLLVETYRSSV